MKNKTSIIYKLSISFYILLVAIFFSSCDIEIWDDNDPIFGGDYIIISASKERFIDKQGIGVYKYEIVSVKKDKGGYKDWRYMLSNDLMYIGDTVYIGRK